MRSPHTTTESTWNSLKLEKTQAAMETQHHQKKKKMKVAIELSYREGWLYNVQKVKCLAPVNTPYIWSIAIIIH